MDYHLSYNPDTNPGNDATNSRYLFNSLGYFWRRIFSDKEVLQGLVLGQVEAAKQAYTDLIGLIDSYSCNSIPVFDKRNWYPLVVYQSSLDNNTLLFGEEVAFGDTVSSQPYIFGNPIPAASGWYSMILPKELKEVGLIVDKVITPQSTLVLNTNYRITNGRIFFNGNPFSLPNINITKVYNADGTYANDQFIILWCYNASVDSENLKLNIGYLFGLNVPHNESGKQILANVVKLYTKGPTINDIKAVCLSCLDLPIITEQCTVSSITTDSTHRNIITNKGTFSYPLIYQLKSGISNGTVLKIGDVPVVAVDLFDNVVESDWWQTELGTAISTPNARTMINSGGGASDLVTQSGRALLPIELPPSMIMASCKGMLIFTNTLEPITMDSNSNVYFPVKGDPADVKAFQTSINNTDVLDILNTQISPDLSLSHPLNFINPVDFIFKAFMKSTTALLRVRFLNTNQLSAFEEYFRAIKDTLPPQILFLVLCEIAVGGEILQLNTALDDTTNVHNYYPLINSNELVSFNSGSGLLIKDMGFSRVPIANPITEQRTINLVVLS